MPFIDLPDHIPGLRMRARADQPWYQFKNIAADEAELFLYDEIGGFGTYAEDFIADLKAVTSPKLKVRVSSPGGSVFDGVAVANALRAHPADVTVQVDGIAASIASVIAMAGDRVVVQPQAMLMVHDASGACLGNAQDMQEMAALLDKISDNIADAYVSKAGGTRDEWRSRMRAESWFTAAEAVEAGLADEVMESGKKQAAGVPEMKSYDLTAYGYTGPQPDTVAARAVVAVQPEAPKAAAPVLGVESMPLTAKAFPVHHTATVDEPWDGPAAVAAMPNDDEVLRYCFAWQSDEAAATPHKEGDDDADDKKANYRFPHHKSKGGPANLAACRNGLARLEGSKIPEGDKSGVRAHLQAHLDDANKSDDSGDGKGGTDNHAEQLPAWLNTDTAPLPAWLATAEEAKL